MALYSLRSSSMLLVATALMGSVDALPTPQVDRRETGWDIVPQLQGTPAGTTDASTGFVGQPFAAAQPQFGTFVPAAAPAGFVAAAPQVSTDPEADRVSGLTQQAAAAALGAAPNTFSPGFQSTTTFDVFGNPVISTAPVGATGNGLVSPLGVSGVVAASTTTPGVAAPAPVSGFDTSQQVFSWSPTGVPLNQFGQPISTTTNQFGAGTVPAAGLGVDVGAAVPSAVQSLRR